MNADSDVRKEIKNDHIIERELGAPAQNGVSPLMYATTVRSINSVRFKKQYYFKKSLPVTAQSNTTHFSGETSCSASRFRCEYER